MDSTSSSLEGRKKHPWLFSIKYINTITKKPGRRESHIMSNMLCNLRTYQDNYMKLKCALLMYNLDKWCNKAPLRTNLNPPLRASVRHVLSKSNGYHVYDPGQKAQLGFELGNGRLDPAKKPSKSFVPTVVLWILVNPPYPSSINKWHTCEEGSLERVVWGWTLTRPIILHFHSAEQSKLGAAKRSRYTGCWHVRCC